MGILSESKPNNLKKRMPNGIRFLLYSFLL